ncbi:glycoside hydrolase family 5 protein [Actinoplanes sp. CA-030573]|uniref:glycoside hydrolase family 5 protein n=1 Tax=Actinoplanes sp. CA-030573 TaxID=3239898 RepID=UPI003D9483D8
MMVSTLHSPTRRVSVPPRRRISARVLIAAATAVCLGGAAAFVVPRLLHRSPPRVCATDAVQARALDDLATFAGWLSRNAVPGYVGEVGWPGGGADAAAWAGVAQVWYDAADAIGLPVTTWAAAGWPAGYPMAVYRRSAGSTAIDSAGPQAAILGGHPSTLHYLRGVVLAGGSFGSPTVADPGRYGYDYSYENAAGYAYLASQDVRLIRLTLSWERLQRRPGGPLDPAELSRLRTALGLAHANGIAVVLDLHGYGTYAATGRPVLGSAALPAERLADLWSKLAAATGDEPAVTGFDLLNEPVKLAAHGAAGAQLWERISQEAVDAIRATGSRQYIAVTGYGQTGPGHLGAMHPRAWINDPVHRTVYETHAYFDGDSSGHYVAGYAAELGRLPSVGRICRVLTAPVPPAPVFAAS